MVYWCRLRKVASVAGRRYFSSLGGRREQHHRMTLDDAIARYSGYRKYIIVRHPLQRVVSGFFEVQRIHDPEGKMRNFTHALRDYILNEVFDPHWMEFYDACRPCEFKYDAVLKAETLETDIEALKWKFQLGLDKEFPMSHLSANPDFHIANHTKYDAILRDLERTEPELFRDLLCKYDVDMKMFGYQWKEHSSVCVSGPGGCC